MNVYKQVYVNKSNGQKLVTIPKKEKIHDRDWVMISKIDPQVLHPKKFRKNKKEVL